MAEMRTLLHDPSFQALESAWQGVQWLTANLELDGPLQLHLFDVTREELIADIVAAQGTLSQTGLYSAPWSIAGVTCPAARAGRWLPH